jgi:superfamily I DNA/RNA helicase
LNEAQKEAVTHPSGPLLIVAGPGTGKTMTLTHRIAFIIKNKSALPENILAITFTNKAALEMRQRLEKLLEGGNQLPLTATFHRFCYQLLKEKSIYENYGIIEETDRLHLIETAKKWVQNSGDEIRIDRADIEFAISQAKLNIQRPEDFFNEDVSENKILSKIYRVYTEALRTQKLFDFDDLISTVVYELETNNAFRSRCRERFQYIFVDEYQDLNHAQYRLLQALSPVCENICVIGDPDQSIYGFRGSDFQHFINFVDDYPDTKTICLDKNYRSTEKILKAAYQMMDGHQVVIPTVGENSRRVYSQKSGSNKNIHVLEMSNELAEADAVAKTIEKIVGGAGYHAVDIGGIDPGDLSDAVGFSDIAVIYRTGDQRRLIAESLSRYGIPFQIAGNDTNGSFSEIRQLLSLYKVVDGMGNYGDFEKIVNAWQPGIGKETIFSFCQWGLSYGYDLAEAMNEVKRFPISGMSRHRQEKVVDLVKIIEGFSRQTTGLFFSEKLQFLLNHTRLAKEIKDNPEILEAFERLLADIEDSANNKEAFFLRKGLETDIDNVSFDVQKVTLMTIHAAKGLEFQVVFVAGCEDDLIPLHRPENNTDIEEERRLFFVAMTRAKQQLFLTWARRRKRFGKNLTRRISPFVSNIDDNLLIRQEPSYGKKRRQVQTQMKLF